VYLRFLSSYVQYGVLRTTTNHVPLAVACFVSLHKQYALTLSNSSLCYSSSLSRRPPITMTYYLLDSRLGRHIKNLHNAHPSTSYPSPTTTTSRRKLRSVHSRPNHQIVADDRLPPINYPTVIRLSYLPYKCPASPTRSPATGSASSTAATNGSPDERLFWYIIVGR
jgi:hypothetical protein